MIIHANVVSKLKITADNQKTPIMKRKFEIILITFMVVCSMPIYCQFLNNYGIKSGIGITSQYWKHKMPDPLPSDWRIDKIGPICQIYIEKSIGKTISLRPELGYIQRGFTDESNFSDENGEYIPIKNNHVVFHYISTDLDIVLTPIHTQIKPYLFGGIRSDYLIGFRDIVFYDKTIETYNSYGDYKKFTFGIVLGIGVTCCNILSFEFEYNPSITKSFSDDFLDTRDRLFGITMAINIEQLINKRKS
jgi:hypothetical protein